MDVKRGGVMLARSLVLVGLGLFTLAFAEGRVISILDPGTAYNREVSRLLVWVMWFAAFVSIVVIGALIYTVVKFRKRPGQEGEPPQIHGNDRLEVWWTAIPLVIVLVIFGLTAQSLVRLSKPPLDAMKIEVTGHQFWWDFNYPELGIRNSNELIVPVGKPVHLVVTSVDVIHSFWAASLVGKQDAIPGVKINLSFTPEKEGNYYGQCAELCGASHSNMRFRVLVVSQEQFDRFVAGAKNFQPPALADANTQKGETLFQQNCASCHTVKGTASQGKIGPDLSFYGNRTTLGSGIWEGKDKDALLEAWIRNSPGVKPGSKMPPFPGLKDEDVKAIASYLNGLKIEGLDFSKLPKF